MSSPVEMCNLYWTLECFSPRTYSGQYLSEAFFLVVVGVAFPPSKFLPVVTSFRTIQKKSSSYNNLSNT
jgi:hypothetical protein